VQKKVTTSFIGALAKVETYIGRKLWAHGSDVSQCTPTELAWREVWEQCRTEILNNGNAQLRAVENEVMQYEISWNKFRYQMPAKNQEEQK
jgi:hypothetical protein